MYNFSKQPNRQNSGAIKWDIYRDRDVLPMWVADMDFESPPEVIQALKDRADHGVFGYTWQTPELVETLISRMKNIYGWDIKEEWIIWLSGLVSGLNVTCRAIGDPGDEVLTSIPIYPPFLSAPGNQERKLAKFEMAIDKNRWVFDFDAFENAISKKSKLFILCNPHNPLGRIFSRDELLTVAELCTKHDLVICSDEIHCDILLDQDKPHLPMALLSPEIADRTITLMAPSKTFNIAGLGLSFAIIPNKKLRTKFERVMRGIVPHPNLFGYTAALAAYKHGGDWLAALLDYVRQNREMVFQRINALPGLTTTHVEATYLAWIDARELPVKDPHKFFEDAGVGLSNGREFNGRGFVRLNFGCPKTMLNQALYRMENAVKKLA